MAEPIVITGVGIVSALGIGRAETLDALRNGRTGVSPAPRYLHTLLRDYPVGEVPLSNDELRTRLGIAADQPANRTSLLGIMAVAEALQQAGLCLYDEFFHPLNKLSKEAVRLLHGAIKTHEV